MEPDYSIYSIVKQLALEKRHQYGIVTGQTGLSIIRKIYKAEGIDIYYRDGMRNLRAAYLSEGGDPAVVLNTKLPNEARIFSLVHELKHHYLDKTELDVASYCLRKYGEEPLVEKSAEVFAAEFIWPENEFTISVSDFGLDANSCSPEGIVRFKCSHTVPVSYKFVVKRLKRLQIINDNSYDKVKFRNLQDAIYGKPFYRR